MPVARRLMYGACDGESGAHFMALVELANKKGGTSIGYVLYCRVVQYQYPAESETKMIRLKADTAEEAIRRYWPGERTGKEFPGYRSKAWEQTTFWLYSVSVGGGYERFPTGTWVKVGRPARRKWRHKKRQLQFGNLGQILAMRQGVLRTLEEEKSKLEGELQILERYDEESDQNYLPEDSRQVHLLSGQKEKIEEEIEAAEAAISATKEEMRHKVRKLFPKPVDKTPKRELRKSAKR